SCRRAPDTRTGRGAAGEVVALPGDQPVEFGAAGPGVDPCRPGQTLFRPVRRPSSQAENSPGACAAARCQAPSAARNSGPVTAAPGGGVTSRTHDAAISRVASGWNCTPVCGP